jgi:hypothetical protein
MIDGDGSFHKCQARITFYILGAPLAYYIKGRLGYGKVTKINSKNAVLLTISNREGLEKVINLVNGKLRVQSNIEAIDKLILNVYPEALKIRDNLHLNTSSDLNNN